LNGRERAARVGQKTVDGRDAIRFRLWQPIREAFCVRQADVDDWIHRRRL
jgi:hypothetical protein